MRCICGSAAVWRQPFIATRPSLIITDVSRRSSMQFSRVENQVLMYDSSVYALMRLYSWGDVVSWRVYSAFRRMLRTVIAKVAISVDRHDIIDQPAMELSEILPHYDTSIKCGINNIKIAVARYGR